MAYDINPWAQKEARKHQAAAHTQLMDKLYSPEIDTCSVNTKIYSNAVSMHHSQTDVKCEIALLDADTVSAVRNNAEGKTAVLNLHLINFPAECLSKDPLRRRKLSAMSHFCTMFWGSKRITTRGIIRIKTAQCIPIAHYIRRMSFLHRRMAVRILCAM